MSAAPHRVARPPRLACALLRSLVPRHHREFALGDLQEQFVELAESAGIPGARRWFWKRTLAAIVARAPAGEAAPAFSMRGEPMEVLLQDLRYALRGLARAPLFTGVAVLALALGIGANTAVFSVARSVLLSSGPFAEPDKLVRIWVTQPKDSIDRGMASSGNFADWEQQPPATLQSVAAYFSWSVNLTGMEIPARLNAVLVTGEFFNTLGTRPLLGRTLSPDDRETSPGLIVLSHGFWTRQFGADPAIVGRTVTINRVPSTVVGVMPPDFLFPRNDVDAWLPFALTPAHRQDRAGGFLAAIARLKPGASLAQAHAEMETIGARQAEAYPQANRGRGARVVALHADEVREIKPALGLLSGAALFVLLLACANVANLMLVRSADRSHELSLRVALGAGRSRLIRQRLTESLTLCALGGTGGVLLAYWLLPLLKTLAPEGVPRMEQVAIDPLVLGFAVSLALAATLLCGLAPAFYGLRRAMHGELALQGRTIAGARLNFRTLLIVGEVAAMVILLAGAGLLARSFAQITRVPLGFEANSLLTMRVWLPGSKYNAGEQQVAFFQQALERIRALPGVQNASAIQDVPLGRNQMMFALHIEGRAVPAGQRAPQAALRAVATRYFETMRIPIVRGRWFAESDHAQAPPVVIVNETLASKFWPQESAIGKRIQYGEAGDAWAEIIGVAGNTKHLGPEEGDEAPAIYQPYSQKGAGMSFLRWQTLLIRTQGRPQDWVAPVRAQILALDGDQPVYDVATMEDRLALLLARPRFALFLMGILGALALALGTLGVYSVLAHVAASRSREIGVRMALGARPGEIFRMVLQFGLSRAVVGVAMGLGGGAALSRYLQTLLFQVSPSDAWTYALVSVAVLGVAGVASLVPAIRAAHVDPVVALRYE